MHGGCGDARPRVPVSASRTSTTSPTSGAGRNTGAPRWPSTGPTSRAGPATASSPTTTASGADAELHIAIEYESALFQTKAAVRTLCRLPAVQRERPHGQHGRRHVRARRRRRSSHFPSRCRRTCAGRCRSSTTPSRRRIRDPTRPTGSAPSTWASTSSPSIFTACGTAQGARSGSTSSTRRFGGTLLSRRCSGRPCVRRRRKTSSRKDSLMGGGGRPRRFTPKARTWTASMAVRGRMRFMRGSFCPGWSSVCVMRIFSFEGR